MQTSKPFSIAATLRGFYDDNPNGLPKEADIEGSFGFEINPSIRLSAAMDTTLATIGYAYSGRYYEENFSGQTDSWRHTHIIDAALQHAIAERYQVYIMDSFVIGQEPDVLRAGTDGYTTYQSISGDNVRNYGSLSVSGQLTRQLGFEIGYDNTYWDFEDEGEQFFPNFQASHSGLLDRMEHSPHVDVTFQMTSQTVGRLGYRYRLVDYTGDEIIGISAAGLVVSEDRNSRSHYGYAGLDHSFRRDLTGSIRAGARFNDYYNDPSNASDWGPYAMLNLNYTYAQESYVNVGFSYDFNATDVASVDSTGDFVRDVESAVLYGTLQHRIVPKLYGSLRGTFQSSTYRGGGSNYDGNSDNYYQFGVDVQYRMTEHFSTHVGYNFDHLDSGVPERGDYDRNRVYIGLTASY